MGILKKIILISILLVGATLFIRCNKKTNDISKEKENKQLETKDLSIFELPETNKRLFYASDISDVFGAMGSWNDSPPCYAAEKGLESEYKKLSSELLTQIRLALLYSVNEW